jgi:hypothetical protein
VELVVNGSILVITLVGVVVVLAREHLAAQAAVAQVVEQILTALQEPQTLVVAVVVSEQ